MKISELGESLDAANAVSRELTRESRDLTGISPESEFRLEVVSLGVAEILSPNGESGWTSSGGEVMAEAEVECEGDSTNLFALWTILLLLFSLLSIFFGIAGYLL